jgi:multicomponent Na+:H+ antiporter subunit D
VLVLSSLLNAVYFFGLMEKVFIQQPKDLEDKWSAGELELPLTMLIPIAVCFIAILGIGIFNVRIVDVLLMTLEGVGL